MTRKRTTAGLAGLTATMLCASPVSADTVLFDNFGPGETYDANVGWTVGHTADWQLGAGFVMNSGGNFQLTSIAASIRHITGSNAVTLSIYDSIGGIPGNLLETSSAVDLPNHDGSLVPPTSFGFSGSTTLLDGETYWVIASTDGLGGAWLSWNWSFSNGLHAQRQGDGGAWQVFNWEQVVMRVEGSLIPTPGTLALLGVGVLGFRRRRR